MDYKLSERIMARHTGRKKNSINTSVCENIFDVSDVSQQLSLAEKIKYKEGEEFQPIPPHLIKKFIAYARNSVSPKLSPQAALVLRRFYTELRGFMSVSPCSPITTRNLESLIRLTEARARLELRPLATEEDAIDVIGILKFSLIDSFSDEMGRVKFPRSLHTTGMSQRNQVKALIAELTRISEIRDCSLFSIDEIREISIHIGIPVLKFEDIIYSLNNQCYLLKKGPQLYQLQTQSCL